MSVSINDEGDYQFILTGDTLVNKNIYKVGQEHETIGMKEEVLKVSQVPLYSLCTKISAVLNLRGWFSYLLLNWKYFILLYVF